MNLLAVSTQLALPTAPPWFHDAYEQTALVQQPTYNQKGHPAGLMRVCQQLREAVLSIAWQVDSVLGTNLFLQGYSKSPVVYGAFPSMHCGTSP